MSDQLINQSLVAIGTKNPAKVHAVQEALIRESLRFITIDAPSGVSCQPFSNEETRTGAINRAKAALAEAETDLGIGLEGGVHESDNGQLFLCNWGALVDAKGHIWEASGLSIPVPSEVQTQLLRGQELGTIMDEISNEYETSKREGAVGFFTNNWISRKEMFSHIVKALYGQYLLTR
ncbi:DUF84 family protein [Alkalicoccobacillus porphyridii]|uniref:inosine/xanthosine triphosphatase n=1 Tax=Alkalicoccobacillus porphyridii TaxID=2597270 RepID=A0A554A329_9BACI|nr:DUF84 family protein [Alkalicoccobacillus porphyridii]TSB48099.1 DUF84 family protein [Alkalicoccobacillus porphyridii]